ncbi:MAG: hypothetical protein LBF58_00960 [Deltaproteobacteria bacterium]|jgi:hypothetical protein|nr:hypothetical protein [Deltaproteobacteria bacterium]
MSEAEKSPWDTLSSEEPTETKALREEVSELDTKLKTVIDQGLPVDEFPVFKGLKTATEAALDIVDKKNQR